MKKHLIFILTATALLFTLSQCKKQEDDFKCVHVTLKVADGSKHDINTVSGAVNYTDGDVLYVTNGGMYRGSLLYESGAFNGELYYNNTYPMSTDDYLHFYFLGGYNPSKLQHCPKVPSTSFTLNISDQSSGNLPVISYGHSDTTYLDNGPATYTSVLENKCALVKFTVNTPSPTGAEISIKDMNNRVSVSFENNEFTYSQVNEGLIEMAPKDASNATWVILLPQEAKTDVQVVSDIYEGTINLPEIQNNSYLTDLAVNLTPPPSFINGAFTVNNSNNKVYFAKGNLQYQASTNTWRIAENQWDYVGGTDSEEQQHFGNVLGSSNNNVSSTYSGWIDLFGWGTSGYNHGAVCYQPWSTDANDLRYRAYGDPTKNLYDSDGRADWGYNAISNGDNTEHVWRTLTWEEWNYIFNTRTGADSKYGHGKVNGVNGMILLPDDWTLPDGLSFTSGDSNWGNVYTAEQWVQMEANGAVFLPAAGMRDGNEISDLESDGNYWSSSKHNNQEAYQLYFGIGIIDPAASEHRFYGYSVRLVRTE